MLVRGSVSMMARDFATWEAVLAAMTWYDEGYGVVKTLADGMRAAFNQELNPVLTQLERAMRNVPAGPIAGVSDIQPPGVQGGNYAQIQVNVTGVADPDLVAGRTAEAMERGFGRRGYNMKLAGRRL